MNSTAVADADRPLLGLVMIVRDEAPGIAQTIASVRPHVDTWSIVDTGSTDGTPDRIAAAFAGVPGALHRAPFVDFAATRNLSLDLAAAAGHAAPVFALVLSGDELWCDPDGALRAFCAARRDPGLRAHAAHGAYNVAVHYGGHVFDSARVVRVGAGWRYVGEVHEVLCKDGAGAPSERVPATAFVLHLPGDGARKDARLYRDLDLLTRAVRARPDDARAAFYYAQTLEELGLYRDAAEAYRRRVELGGWREEVYEAAYRRARASLRAEAPWGETLVLFLDAHRRAPHRAEPLYAIASVLAARDEHASAYLFARRAAELAFPARDTLFVQADIYRWMAHDLVARTAFRVGEFATGEAAARAAAAVRPDDERLAASVARYAGRTRTETVTVLPYPTLLAVPARPADAAVARYERHGVRLDYRPESNDAEVIAEVVANDTYRLRGAVGAALAASVATPLVLDIGGHIGSFAALVASVAPRARVVSCEPDPENFAFLARNTAALPGVRAERVAVAGRVRPAGLRRVVGNTGGTRVRVDAEDLATDDAAAPAATLPVALDAPLRGATLAAILAAADPAADARVALLKMDCEGAEHEALRAAALDGVLGRVDRIALEYHDFYGDDLDGLLGLLGPWFPDLDVVPLSVHTAMVHGRSRRAAVGA